MLLPVFRRRNRVSANLVFVDDKLHFFLSPFAGVSSVTFPPGPAVHQTTPLAQLRLAPAPMEAPPLGKSRITIPIYQYKKRIPIPRHLRDSRKTGCIYQSPTATITACRISTGTHGTAQCPSSSGGHAPDQWLLGRRNARARSLARLAEAHRGKQRWW